MKSYPSIPKSIKYAGEEPFWIFDKPDGSNLRFEWDRRQGWGRTGTRTRLLNETDPVLGPAKHIFCETMAEPLDRIARECRWEAAVFFAEFWGTQSFAGQHVAGDDFRLTLFDAAPYKKGILGPEAFWNHFGHLPFAVKLLGRGRWDAELIEAVRTGQMEGVTFEGVVGKRGEGHRLQMVKAKSQAWIDRVREKYAPEDADRIINS